jgi:DNA-binding beta-propeller fold protein YncE
MAIAVDDPYNMYFSPDGKSAIVVAEALKRLDFRDPVTMKLQYTIDVPRCAGINHADFAIDGRFAIFTCEFAGTVAKVDLVNRKVLGYTQVIQPGRPTKVVKGPDGKDQVICTTWKGMPQDIRASPDGKLFYVADMMADGVHVLDGETFRQVGFIETGKGTHGLYPSRDGKKLYVANRGSNKIHGPPKGKGGVSVIDFATQKVEANWLIPGGGSPDMGNVSADGKWLWLSGRYDNVVYAFDTSNGEVKIIPVGKEPHGLTGRNRAGTGPHRQSNAKKIAAADFAGRSGWPRRLLALVPVRGPKDWRLLQITAPGGGPRAASARRAAGSRGRSATTP